MEIAKKVFGGGEMMNRWFAVVLQEFGGLIGKVRAGDDGKVHVKAVRLQAAQMGTGDRRVWRTKGLVRLTSCKLNYKVHVTAF